LVLSIKKYYQQVELTKSQLPNDRSSGKGRGKRDQRSKLENFAAITTTVIADNGNHYYGHYGVVGMNDMEIHFCF
jgi:hypothetical protein